jgi:manganese/iron transport system substrate-binding protein
MVTSYIAVFILLMAGLAACAAENDGDSDDSGDAQSGDDDRLSIAVSMPFLPSLVTAVTGDLADVESIVPQGADAHTYQPSPGDAQLIAEADLIITNGMGLEEFLDDLIESAGGVDVPVIALADELESEAIEYGDGHEHEHHDDEHAHEDEHHDDEHEHEEEHEHDHHDDGDEHDHDHVGANPHFWLDPAFGVRYIERIAEEVSAIDPDNAGQYEENAAAYIAEIEEFDEWAMEQMAAIPDENRKMVTFHDAFPYFAEHYDLEVVGVVVRSPGREPGAQEVAQLADQIREVGVPAVFVEPQFNPQLAEAIADEAGVEVRMLYSDSPAEGDGYLEMMRANVENVVEGLS